MQEFAQEFIQIFYPKFSREFFPGFLRKTLPQSSTINRQDVSSRISESYRCAYGNSSRGSYRKLLREFSRRSSWSSSRSSSGNCSIICRKFKTKYLWASYRSIPKNYCRRVVRGLLDVLFIFFILIRVWSSWSSSEVHSSENFSEILEKLLTILVTLLLPRTLPEFHRELYKKFILKALA